MASSVLLYTKKSGSVVVLTVRYVKSTPHSLMSTSYYGPIIVIPEESTDIPEQYIPELLSRQLKGVFLQSGTETMESALRKRISREAGVVCLPNPTYTKLWLIPVNHISRSKLSELNMDFETKWLNLDQVFTSEIELNSHMDLYSPFRDALLSNYNELQELMKAVAGVTLLPQPEPISPELIEENVESNSGNRYRCAKCRTPLFDDSELELHDQGDGQTNFSWKKRSQDANVVCTGMFLDSTIPKIEAMANCEEADGKLTCPNEKCKTSIGRFSWVGTQCSCGFWVSPAFKISNGKVDLIRTNM